MYREYIQRIIKRFSKIFVLGMIASISLQIMDTHSIHTLLEFKLLLITMGKASLVAGLAATEKALQGSNQQ